MSKIGIKALWSPQSYINFKRYIDYFHPSDAVFQRIAELSPIVDYSKILRVRNQIMECENKRSTLLHIGDCAEPFEDASREIVTKKIEFFKQCSEILREKKLKDVCLIGRIAGQYAKPRSNEFMYVNGVKIHNYKGDNVNHVEEHDRDPSHSKILEGYENSVKVASFIEADYPQMFISHEGLILPYEAALTRKIQDDHYCQSAHMIWIGERTRQLDGAHIQFFRGLKNPIGMKISSKISESQILSLVRTLNPNNEKGKLLVIIRMGKDNVKGCLQKIIKVKNNEGLNFLFVTDPMHGNTFESKQAHGLKTRRVEHMLEQIKYFEQKMQENGLGYGYSLEATYEDVTECHGLKRPFQQNEITKQLYKSKCDPRLNREQTLALLQILSSN